jgi:hypothetical protein
MHLHVLGMPVFAPTIMGKDILGACEEWPQRGEQPAEIRIVARLSGLIGDRHPCRGRLRVGPVHELAHASLRQREIGEVRKPQLADGASPRRCLLWLTEGRAETQHHRPGIGHGSAQPEDFVIGMRRNNNAAAHAGPPRSVS